MSAKPDYIMDLNGRKIFLETEQINTRLAVIGEYKKLREEMGITQTKLGELTGISQPNITRFESGRYNPSLDMMVRVAAAMGKNIKISLVD